MFPIPTLERNLPMCSFSELVFFCVFAFMFKSLIHLEIILVMGEMYSFKFFLHGYPINLIPLIKISFPLYQFEKYNYYILYVFI